MNSVKKERLAKSAKDLALQKKTYQNLQSKKELKHTEKTDTNPSSSTLYRSESGNLFSQKIANANSPNNQRTSIKADNGNLKDPQLLSKQESSKQLKKINQGKQHNQTRKKTFTNAITMQKHLLQAKEKYQQLAKQVQKLTYEKIQGQQKIKNVQEKLIKAQSQIDQLEKQNQELNIKMNKMKERAQQNKKALFSKVNVFNQQGDGVVKLQTQMESLRQQNQSLRQQLKRIKKSIQQNECNKNNQEKRSILGVQKINQDNVSQRKVNKNRDSINSADDQQVKQGFQRLLKQISQTFSNRTQQYRQRIAQQQSEIEKLELIIDRYYQENLSGQKLKVTLDTDQQLLHQIQLNQNLQEQLKQLKQKNLLLQLQNQSWQEKHKDAICYLEIQRIKSRGVIVKRIQDSRVYDKSDQSSQYGLTKYEGYYNCKCENQQEILKSQIERLKVQISEAKRLGQIYFQDNKKKEQIIKFLSTPRKTTVQK